jgi:hypothetical protein
MKEQIKENINNPKKREFDEWIKKKISPKL